jgi:hypothetical protein
VTANAYCTLSEVKQALPDGNWDATYDGILAVLTKRASRALDRECKVPPGYFCVTADTVRLFAGSGKPQQWVDELATAPTLVEMDEAGEGHYVVVPRDAYFLWPWNAPDEGQPYRRLDFYPFKDPGFYFWYNLGDYPTVRITGKWGWSTVTPEEVKQLAIIQAAKWFKRGQQGYADTGGVVELGQLRYTQALDPDIAELCKGLTRPTI